LRSSRSLERLRLLQLRNKVRLVLVARYAQRKQRIRRSATKFQRHPPRDILDADSASDSRTSTSGSDPLDFCGPHYLRAV
jgi:hypothetical protein